MRILLDVFSLFLSGTAILVLSNVFSFFLESRVYLLS